MNESQAEKVVSAIIRDLHGGPPDAISPDSDLFGDLGIDGDDAVDVFRALATNFQVDFSGIDWDRHFGPEAGFSPLALLLPSWWRWHRERIPVTVRDLAECVVAKRWTLSYPPR